jgi:hypothetical protein
MKLALSLAVTVAMAVSLAAGSARADVTLPTFVHTAVTAALAVPGGRVVPLSYEASRSSCQATSATFPRPIEGSGRHAVKLSGDNCSGWGWVKLQVWAPVLVTKHTVREGEPLAAAVEPQERPVTMGQTAVALPPGAVAARAMSGGQIVTPTHVRGGTNSAGTSIKVIAHSGSLQIEIQGKLIACGPGKTCAVLPSGRHVEGQLVDNRLMVELP